MASPATVVPGTTGFVDGAPCDATVVLLAALLTPAPIVAMATGPVSVPGLGAVGGHSSVVSGVAGGGIEAVTGTAAAALAVSMLSLAGNGTAVARVQPAGTRSSTAAP